MENMVGKRITVPPRRTLQINSNSHINCGDELLARIINWDDDSAVFRARIESDGPFEHLEFVCTIEFVEQCFLGVH